MHDAQPLLMHDTAVLGDLIRRKHQVLTQLRDIGRRQAQLVETVDVGIVLKLLAVKQELITALQEIEHRLKPHYGQDPDQRTWSSVEYRAECARLATDCNAMLAEIVQLEKLGAEKMTARRNEVAEQLQQVHVANHVRNAYEAQRRGHS